MLEINIDAELKNKAKSRMIWVNHKGTDILYEDYTNLRGVEIAELVPAITQITIKEDYTNILLLLNLNNSFANKDALDAFGASGKISKDRLTKTAVLGITGVKKILLNVVNRIANLGAKAFNTEEEAKDWLISGEQ